MIITTILAQCLEQPAISATLLVFFIYGKLENQKFQFESLNNLVNWSTHYTVPIETLLRLNSDVDKVN